MIPTDFDREQVTLFNGENANAETVKNHFFNTANKNRLYKKFIDTDLENVNRSLTVVNEHSFEKVDLVPTEF